MLLVVIITSWAMTTDIAHKWFSNMFTAWNCQNYCMRNAKMIVQLMYINYNLRASISCEIQDSALIGMLGHIHRICRHDLFCQLQLKSPSIYVINILLFASSNLFEIEFVTLYWSTNLIHTRMYGNVLLVVIFTSGAVSTNFTLERFSVFLIL